MCNRYRMTAKQAEIAARYGIVSPTLKTSSLRHPSYSQIGQHS
jgi:putative SOS response-associated peptidase YedK